jgi:Glycosyl hydrolase family 79 C-terminal beta domain
MALTWHRYPLNTSNATVEGLLAANANNVLNGISTLTSQAQTSSGVSRPFILSECNSVAGGGKEGVSNVYASALWAVDFLFEIASKKAEAVQLHTTTTSAQGTGGWYSPFRYSRAGGVSTLVDINPSYYAMYLFVQAAQNGGKIIPVTFNNPGNYNVKLWCVKDNAGKLRLVTINKTTNEYQIKFSVSTGKTTGELIRLTAPSITAKYGDGVKLAGQTFDNATDGLPKGVRVTETVVPANGGKDFSFLVKSYQVTMMTID